LRDRLGDIRARGGELAIVGNGARRYATAFREDLELDLDVPILLDPELRAYRKAELRRGHLELLSPRVPLNALRALTSGFRQTSIEGDAFQLGGVFVIAPGGEVRYRYVSREAGDHPPIDAVLDALPGHA
jgi:hypothetical protein